MKTYYTHNNGGRPYKVNVNISVKRIQVYASSNEHENPDEDTYEECVFNEEYEIIFIGKSKRNAMTTFSGGFGKDFDGNTILIKRITGENEYVYFGERVLVFHTYSPIVTYESPVGNNDVPYPYAIDTEENYYLMIERAILISPIIPRNTDVYSYYYSDMKVKGMMMVVTQSVTREEEETYWLSYTVSPEETYDRLVEENGILYMRETETGVQTRYTKEAYCSYIGMLGAAKGYRPFF
jgi:hypothetical protein